MRAVATVLLVATFGALSCGDEKRLISPTTPTPTIRAQSITISGRTSLRQPGDTSQLTVVVTFSDGTTKETNADTTWLVDSTKVVSVTPTGLLMALAYGTATVTARYGSPALGASANVRVMPDGTFILKGFVTESGFGIEDVRVEASSPAGTVTAATNVVGYYTLLPVAADSTVRAEKNGFVPQIKRVTATDDQQLDFDLQRVNPLATVDGVYELAITASSSCTTLPAEVRRRTYAAQVAEEQGKLFVTLKDADDFWGGDADLTGSRSGNTATFAITDDPLAPGAIFEQIGEDAFLVYRGTAVGEITERRIVGTFNGGIYLIHLRRSEGVIAECRATDHPLEFVR